MQMVGSKITFVSITHQSLKYKCATEATIIYSSEFVPLTISYHLYFLRISDVPSMLHHVSVGWVYIKECYFIVTYTFLAFLLLFLSQNLCFYHFHFFFFSFFFFWWSIELPKQNINQSETRISDKKLSVELYIYTTFQRKYKIYMHAIKTMKLGSLIGSPFRSWCKCFSMLSESLDNFWCMF